MKLKPIIIDNLALMICGDEEYKGIFRTVVHQN
jgi:hypothetical protein